MPEMSAFLHRILNALKHPRWRWALLGALVSDALGFGLVLLPPVQWGVDAVTAVFLLFVIGVRWPLVPALAIEVIPGLQVFPAWTLVVIAMAGTETRETLPDPDKVGTEAGAIQNQGISREKH